VILSRILLPPFLLLLIPDSIRLVLTPHHVLIEILIHYPRLVLVAADVHYLASAQLLHPAARPPPILPLRAPRPAPTAFLSVHRELIQVLELGHDLHYVVHMILFIEVHLEVPHVWHVPLDLITNRLVYVLDQVVSEI
jgi:hypothetical protein